MQDITQAEAIHWLATQQKITFLTGAGISTASGVPDYRSLKGVYQGIQQPEYLLSRTCLKTEPEKFYQFVKTLYHPDAQPNIIHQKMAQLEQMKRGKLFHKILMGFIEKQVAKKWWTFTVIYMNVIAKLVVQRFLGKTIYLVIGMQTVMDKSVQLLLCMKKAYPKRQSKKPFRPLLLPT